MTLMSIEPISIRWKMMISDLSLNLAPKEIPENLIMGLFPLQRDMMAAVKGGLIPHLQNKAKK
jgi:hypothetical protein